VIEPNALKKLGEILGPGGLIKDAVGLTCYSYDAMPYSPEGNQRVMPDAVALPRDADQVCEIVSLANEFRFPIVPRGAGTGMTGGARPTMGGLVLAFSRMNNMEILDKDLTARVQPGVITSRIQQEAERAGLFYPPDPASSEACTIGGNIAENAGGLRAVKYGVTRDYVLGLDAVLGDATRIKAGAKTVKSVAGLDMVSLLAGSEGTLGLVLEAWLKLLPLPESRCTLLALFETADQAASAAPAILTARLDPTALEFMDRYTIECVADQLDELGTNIPGAMLLVELDGGIGDTKRRIRDVRSICTDLGAYNTRISDSEEAREQLWKARKAISPALGKLAPFKIDEDVAVPRSRLAELVRGAGEIGLKNGLKCACYGHAGDGNLHVNYLVPAGEKPAGAEKVARELFELAISLGGTISGEHGIGTAKRMYLELETGRAGLDIMASVKQALDPKGIMNPGKLLPKDYDTMPGYVRKNTE